MDTNVIDSLLERYLTLLDEYTQLRSRLNDLQSSIYQNIARSNFSAERGLRYGSDHYDERMQALRRLKISPSSDPGHGGPSITLHASETQDDKKPTPEAAEKEADDHDEKEAESTKKLPRKTQNPLQWFGILTPQPLKLAQGQAIQAVEECIPRLASLSAEMAEVEIEIRRARKKRAKAEAADKKQSKELMSEGVKA